MREKYIAEERKGIGIEKRYYVRRKGENYEEGEIVHGIQAGRINARKYVLFIGNGEKTPFGKSILYLNGTREEVNERLEHHAEYISEVLSSRN